MVIPYLLCSILYSGYISRVKNLCESAKSAEKLISYDLTIAFWQGSCVFTSTDLGSQVLLLRIDQPLQSSQMFDAHKSIWYTNIHSCGESIFLVKVWFRDVPTLVGGGGWY